MRLDKALVQEIIRYLIVGGIATIIDYLAFALFRYVILDLTLENLLISTSIGFAFGLTFNYILSIVFVFKNVSDPNKGKKLSSFILFAFIGIIGLGLTEFGMWISYITRFFVGDNVYQIPEMLMKVVMTGIVLIWNYVARKLLIFQSPKSEQKEITS
jgi:putative flippase GtrA